MGLLSHRRTKGLSLKKTSAASTWNASFYKENQIVLQVRIEKFGTTAILHCSGRIVRGHESALLCAAVRQNASRVILDLAEVEAIDAAGVGALLSLQAAGVYLQLLDPTNAVQEVLRLTRVDTVLEICESPALSPLRSGNALHPCYVPG
jgi:anti-anti-sigma factor